MSRDPYPRVQAESIHLLADAAIRIADVLDDYMEMSLAAQELIVGLKTTDQRAWAELAPIFDPLLKALTAIRERRSNR